MALQESSPTHSCNMLQDLRVPPRHRQEDRRGERAGNGQETHAAHLQNST